MPILLSLCVGIGLSAACGFRVFLPLFALGLANRFGDLPLHESFQWISSTPALLALGTATICEILGYFIPYIDHLLDTMASPMAILAGVIATAAVLSNDTSPWLQWSLAVIAGGGVAAATQTSTVLLRGLSTLTTGGLGNPLVALGELILSAITSILTLLFPFVVAIVVIIGLLITLSWFKRRQPSPQGGIHP